MKKVLISGYYGFGNIGDEAILKAMITEFNKMAHKAEVTVLSGNPVETNSKFHVQSEDRSHLYKVIQAIRKCDVLISGGGSLLQESTGRLSVFYYLFIYFVALIFRKKIVIYSQGIGPVHRKFTKKLIKYVFNKAFSISVRDRQSRDELISYGLDPHKISVTADPVIGFTKFGKELGEKVLESKGYIKEIPTIGFALKNSTNKCVVEDFVKIIDKLKEKPCNIVLLPFHQKEDQAIIEDIVKLSKHTIIAASDRYEVNTVFSLIENFDVLVGIRLHALIFSSVSETPVVAISYDPKIDAFMTSINQKAVSEIDTIDIDMTVKTINETIANKKKIQDQLKIQVFKHKIKLTQYNSQIDQLLD